MTPNRAGFSDGSQLAPHVHPHIHSTDHPSCGSQNEPLKTQIRDAEDRLVVSRGGERGGELGEGARLVQTSSYKISKSWGCKVERGDYS